MVSPPGSLEGRCRHDTDPGATRADAEARRLLHLALDVADLLVDDVLIPTAEVDDQADLVKETAEVAMLLRAASTLGGGDLDLRVRRTATKLAPLARHPELARRIAFRPSGSAPLALAHACLARAGCPDVTMDAVTRHAFAARAAHGGDRTPYRILDVAWIRHLVLGDEELLDHPILPATCLGRTPDLVGTTIDEAYAFSHTLPYATDFGRLPLPGWVDRTAQSTVADALIAKALAEDDLDLLGELLMVPTLLRRPWSPVQVFGWWCLTRVWRHHPILPGPGIPPEPDHESDLERRRRVLGTVYHTSLVGGLLMATTLKHGEAPVLPLDVRTLGGARFDPTWRGTWAALDASDRAHVAMVPEVIELHGALADVDLARVLAVLRRPGSAGLPEPLAVQAIELLQRVCALPG